MQRRTRTGARSESRAYETATSSSLRSAAPIANVGKTREANAIKAVFDRDRSQFQRRVKVVLLPGATIDDIPMEMLSSVERFRIPSFDLAGMDNLLRSLHGKPAWPKPALGRVPALPPTYVANISAATKVAGATDDVIADEPQSALRRRLAQIDDELTTSSPPAGRLQAHERQPLLDERDVIASSLVSLDHVASRIDGDRRPRRPESTSRMSCRRREVRRANALKEAQQAMTTLPAIAQEALFQYFHNGQPLTVGGTLDRFGLEDAVRNEEAGFLSWVEDVEQTVSARQLNPHVDAAITALQRVRRSVFGGVSWKGRAEAAPWARTLLREEYAVDDPEFELRPVWVALGFLSR
jgi:hypothetical protein